MVTQNQLEYVERIMFGWCGRRIGMGWLETYNAFKLKSGDGTCGHEGQKSRK